MWTMRNYLEISIDIDNNNYSSCFRIGSSLSGWWKIQFIVCFICSLLDPDLCISWWQIYSGKKVDLVSVCIAVNNYYKNCSMLEMHSAIALCNTYAPQVHSNLPLASITPLLINVKTIWLFTRWNCPFD